MEGYDSVYYETTTVDSAAAAGLGLAFFSFVLIITVISYVIGAILLGMIFKKAGVPAWKAWVPIYSTWVTLELGKQSGWWALLMLVPFVNIVALIFYYIALYHIGLSLQKEGWFILLAIFVPIVWFVWLALDKSTWEGSQAPAPQQPPTVPPTTPQPVA